MKNFLLIALMFFSLNALAHAAEMEQVITAEAQMEEFGPWSLNRCEYVGERMTLETTEASSFIMLAALEGTEVWKKIPFDVLIDNGQHVLIPHPMSMVFYDLTACPDITIKVLHE